MQQSSTKLKKLKKKTKPTDFFIERGEEKRNHEYIYFSNDREWMTIAREDIKQIMK